MPLSTLIDPGLVREMLALKPGQHLCLIYEDDPIEQMPALLPFISQGLDKNEQCIYIDPNPLGRINEVVAAVGRALERGQQVYWVCPLVAESEVSDLAAALCR